MKIKKKCKFDFVKIYNPNFVIFVRRLLNKHFCKLDKILRTFVVGKFLFILFRHEKMLKNVTDLMEEQEDLWRPNNNIHVKPFQARLWWRDDAEKQIVSIPRRLPTIPLVEFICKTTKNPNSNAYFWNMCWNICDHFQYLLFSLNINEKFHCFFVYFRVSILGNRSTEFA